MRRLFLRLANVFRRDAAERELAREIASHLALLEEGFQRKGLPLAEARLAARRAIGGIEQAKDRHRDARSFPWLDDLYADTRYAWRTLFANPGFTIVAVLTLALGIGANTAIFSVINAILLNPLPFKDADRLVRLIDNVPSAASPNGRPLRTAGIDVREVIELRKLSRPLSHVVNYGSDIVTLVGASGDGSLTGVAVSAGTFAMLGVPPRFGRAFLPEEEGPDGPKAIVLSHGTWQRLFGGDPNVLGKAVTFTGAETFIGGTIERGTPYTIVGVMPASFHFPDDSAQFWTPRLLVPPADGRPRRIAIMARLADGVSPNAAVAEVSAILHQMRGDAQKPSDQWSRFELVRVKDELTGPLRTPLLTLTGAVAFVLLIACANVANLLLARMSARRREISVRLALGAGRGRLGRQILTETVLLGLLGGAAGTALAFGGVRAFRRLGTSLSRFDLASNASASFPRLDAIGIDGSVFAFAVSVSVFTGLVFGLLPAVSQSWADQIHGLRGGAASSSSGFRVRGDRAIQGSLVVAEIAVAMLLLVGGGLMIGSFVKLASVNPGFDPSNVLTFQVAIRGDRYSGAGVKSYTDDLVARLRSSPSVKAAAYARQLPFVPLQETFTVRTTPAPPGPPPFQSGADARFVSGGYLETMGVRVVAGRALSRDGQRGGPPELVINQALAHRDFGGDEAVGRQVYVGREAKPFQIVGVVDDIHQFGLDREPQPQFFADLSQFPSRSGPGQFPLGPYFVVRTQARLSAMLSDITAVARQLDSQSTLYNVATMEEIVANSVVRPRLYAVLLGIFAGVAATLAAIGIFGVMAYSVAQRTKEIGIRRALGARDRQVIQLVLGQSLVLVVLGIGLGIAGAAALTRYLESMLFGVTPLDPSTFIAVSVLFAVIAMLASYVPARRATKVDPLIALRCE